MALTPNEYSSTFGCVIEIEMTESNDKDRVVDQESRVEGRGWNTRVMNRPYSLHISSASVCRKWDGYESFIELP